MPNPLLDPYRNKLAKLRSRLNNPTFESRIPVIQKRINRIRTKAGVGARDWSNWKPKYATTTTTPTIPAADPIQDNISQLQPEAAQVTPGVETTDFTVSPMYKWQQQQGQKALNEQLSARGLYDSGAALQAGQDMQQQLMANEVARQFEVDKWKKEIESGNADLSQANSMANANRLWDILSSEAARKDVLGQNQFNNKLSVLNWLSEQNPMKYVAGSIGDSANMQADMGKYVSQYMSQMYPQLFQYLQNIIPDFYATGATGSTSGGSAASKAGAANNA